MISPIHPFPARMAPELVLRSLSNLPPNSIVLDPFAGSGTVLRHAVALGHSAVGFDLDPLAVLMARVWITPASDLLIEEMAQYVIDSARALHAEEIMLPWIDDHEETESFVRYWFGLRQRRQLRRLAYVLNSLQLRKQSKKEIAAANVLRVALSRTIVTKNPCSSLARDTSHSRPRRVRSSSDYDVFAGFERSRRKLQDILSTALLLGKASVGVGDARKLKGVRDGTVDAVVTSPPYLNAIDYMRAHRFSLVWLGHSVDSLRKIRSNSVGSERRPEIESRAEARLVRSAIGDLDRLPTRFRGIVDRFCVDLFLSLDEIARVLRPGGTATFVMGNSCIRGVFLRNADALAAAAKLVGLRQVSKRERELPIQHRCLPVPHKGSLGKRIRTETVLKFVAHC
jgi:hypothetical protein